MKVHAIQTGFVRIKTAQVEGRGHGLERQLAIFTDSNWTDWLPTYGWAIEHRDRVSADEGVSSKPESHSILTCGGRSLFASSVKKRSDRSFVPSGSDRAM